MHLGRDSQTERLGMTKQDPQTERLGKDPQTAKGNKRKREKVKESNLLERMALRTQVRF